jgi:hypothetical protein
MVARVFGLKVSWSRRWSAIQTGAFTLPRGSKDAAVLLTLNPGAYTAQIKSAKNASSGVARRREPPRGYEPAFH